MYLQILFLAEMFANKMCLCVWVHVCVCVMCGSSAVSVCVWFELNYEAHGKCWAHVVHQWINATNAARQMQLDKNARHDNNNMDKSNMRQQQQKQKTSKRF